MSEIQTHEWECPCELCEPEAHSVRELPPTVPVYESARTSCSYPNVQSLPRVTPLQRAALDNGLAFDIVDKLRAWGTAGGLGAETLARLLTDVQTDQALEEALSRSACAREPERSRVWWHGVIAQ